MDPLEPFWFIMTNIQEHIFSSIFNIVGPNVELARVPSCTSITVLLTEFSSITRNPNKFVQEHFWKPIFFHPLVQKILLLLIRTEITKMWEASLIYFGKGRICVYMCACVCTLHVCMCCFMFQKHSLYMYESNSVIPPSPTHLIH